MPIKQNWHCLTLNSAKNEDYKNEDNHVIIAVGTTGIILQAPSLYDLRPAIDEYLSEIEVAVAKPKGRIENY